MNFFGLFTTNLYDDVRSVFQILGDPIGTSPKLPTPERLAERHAFISEEVREVSDAGAEGDIAHYVLENVDVIFLAFGNLVEAGIEPHQIQAAWREVCECNAAKLWPDGSAHRSPQGKILKPPNWTPPDKDVVWR